MTKHYNSLYSHVVEVAKDGCPDSPDDLADYILASLAGHFGVVDASLIPPSGYPRAFCLVEETRGYFEEVDFDPDEWDTDILLVYDLQGNDGLIAHPSHIMTFLLSEDVARDERRENLIASLRKMAQGEHDNLSVVAQAANEIEEMMDEIYRLRDGDD